MYEQCNTVGREMCLPVYYEQVYFNRFFHTNINNSINQLVLHPEREMRRILEFLNMPWNASVLHHEMFIGNAISLSKSSYYFNLLIKKLRTERSSDQVVKPVNLGNFHVNYIFNT